MKKKPKYLLEAAIAIPIIIGLLNCMFDVIGD